MFFEEYRRKNKKYNYGFSILEILLALALASVLLICVLRVYLSVKSLYSKIEQSITTQNHLRFLSYYLQRKITMAGYAGCGKLANLNIKNKTSFSFNLANSVKGFNSNSLPSQLRKYQIAPNTDVIVIQKADDGVSYVTEDVMKGAKEFHAEANPATLYNNFLLLADCRKADLFVAQNVGGKLISTKTPIAHEYKKGATQVSRYTEIAYFISSSTSAYKTQERSKYGLYYTVNYGNKARLLDEINSMQISYGVANAAGEINGYFSAEQVSQGKLWNKVKSVILTITPEASSRQSKVKTWDIYINLHERS